MRRVCGMIDQTGSRAEVAALPCKRALHPGGNPGANLKSTSHRCYLFEVAFVWELTKETIVLPLGCLQDGRPRGYPRAFGCRVP